MSAIRVSSEIRKEQKAILKYDDLHKKKEEDALEDALEDAERPAAHLKKKVNKEKKKTRVEYECGPCAPC